MAEPTTPIAGTPKLTKVSQHLVTPAAPVTGRVVVNEICTASRKSAGFVRHVAIDVSGTPLEGSFRAGQSFGVIAPGVDEKGRPHKLRLYSIAAPSAGEDGQGRVLSTSVKRVIDENWEGHRLFLGVCSNYLCDLQEGDEVLVTGPAGKRFLLPEDPGEHEYLFFATGTGIAPFRAMLGDLEAAGFPSRTVLVMGSPYSSDLIYHQELQALAEREERFTYLTAISREPDAEVGKGIYVQDRLTTHAGMLGEMLESDRTLLYVCGIAGMELGIFRGLHGLLPPDQLGHYLQMSPELASDPASWTRKMIPREIKPTRRVFLEVY